MRARTKGSRVKRSEGWVVGVDRGLTINQKFDNAFCLPSGKAGRRRGREQEHELRLELCWNCAGLGLESKLEREVRKKLSKRG